MTRLRTRAGQLVTGAWLDAVGTFAAAILLVTVNLLAARFDHSWDLTPHHRFSLTPSSLRVVRALPEDTEILVFLSHSDPTATPLGSTLQMYTTASRRVQLKWLDPDLAPARYVAAQTELGLLTSSTHGTHVVADTVLVLRSGARRQLLSAQELLDPDAENAASRDRIELAITGALVRLSSLKPKRTCFATGHRELSSEDRSSVGLSEFAARLTKSGSVVRQVPIDGSVALHTECDTLVLASPELPYESAELERLLLAARSETSLLLLGGTLPDDTGQVRGLGLEPVFALAGVRPGLDLVLEHEPSRRLPTGEGEQFLALPTLHAITAGLLRGSPRLVRVSVAQSLSAAPGSQATPLLSASASGYAVSSLRESDSPRHSSASTAPVVAMASEWVGKGGSRQRGVFAPAAPFQNGTTPATSVAERAFADSSCAWLSAEAAAPLELEQQSEQPKLELSEAVLRRVTLVGLVLLPATAASIGLLWLLWRRRTERRAPSPGSKK